jgi:oxygen-independent coproporphyrinogen-3 oxidase
MSSTENTGSAALALYIHIPFCRQKCRYCSFVSYTGREDIIPSYIEAVKREFQLRLKGGLIQSIYLGGGTPSLLSPAQIKELLDSIASMAEIGMNAEITMEANPGTVDLQYLSTIKEHGINRLSLGVQSFNDDELALLGRIHNADEAIRSIEMARQAGFDNLNIDLIYGLPGQSLQKWRRNLERIIRVSPEHISLYSLTLEEETPLAKDIERGKISPSDPDTAADQYEAAGDLLASAGYAHYEISNWAKYGCQCKHNLVYWQCCRYLGVGVAAHSYLDDHRLANAEDLDEYINKLNMGSLAVEMEEEIDSRLQLSEHIILALRLSGGVSSQDIKNRFGIEITEMFKNQLAELEQLGLVELTADALRLTDRGRLLGNEVFQRFLP